MSLYNCQDQAELEKLRADPRGTSEVDTSELTFATPNNNADMLEWNGYSVYVLAIDGNTAEVFIP